MNFKKFILSIVFIMVMSLANVSTAFAATKITVYNCKTGVPIKVTQEAYDAGKYPNYLLADDSVTVYNKTTGESLDSYAKDLKVTLTNGYGVEGTKVIVYSVATGKSKSIVIEELADYTDEAGIPWVAANQTVALYLKTTGDSILIKGSQVSAYIAKGYVWGGTEMTVYDPITGDDMAMAIEELKANLESYSYVVSGTKINLYNADLDGKPANGVIIKTVNVEKLTPEIQSGNLVSGYQTLTVYYGKTGEEKEIKYLDLADCIKSGYVTDYTTTVLYSTQDGESVNSLGSELATNYDNGYIIAGTLVTVYKYVDGSEIQLPVEKVKAACSSGYVSSETSVDVYNPTSGVAVPVTGSELKNAYQNDGVVPSGTKINLYNADITGRPADGIIKETVDVEKLESKIQSGDLASGYEILTVYNGKTGEEKEIKYLDLADCIKGGYVTNYTTTVLYSTQDGEAVNSLGSELATNYSNGYVIAGTLMTVYKYADGSEIQLPVEKVKAACSSGYVLSQASVDVYNPTSGAAVPVTGSELKNAYQNNGVVPSGTKINLYNADIKDRPADGIIKETVDVEKLQSKIQSGDLVSGYQTLTVYYGKTGEQKEIKYLDLADCIKNGYVTNYTITVLYSPKDGGAVNSLGSELANYYSNGYVNVKPVQISAGR